MSTTKDDLSEITRSQFEYFLSKSVKTTRVRGQFLFSSGTVHNYLSFCDSASTYVEKYSNTKYKSIFEIVDPKEVEDIVGKVIEDEGFQDKDKEKNINGLMSGALMYYVCFINARTYFSTNKNAENISYASSDPETYEEYVAILKELNSRFGSLSYYLFGIKYGRWLSNINISKLVEDAGLTSSMSKELNKGKRLFEIIDSGEFYIDWKHKNHHVNVQTAHPTTQPNSTLSFLTALRTKPFMLLAGISGTGKSRIVRKLAQASTTQKYENTEDRWKDNRPENFELIQVKPNWHNSMDVVGYYSNVAKRYEFPPFIDFIVKAWQDLETPYFLCLDEMNLAPVEQYFAEFLSAIESRSIDADGNYVTDPIIKPFKKFGEKEGKAMLVQLFGVPDPIDKNPLALQFFEKGLTLPKNLLVMGTVNMDETTFSFSRKVLDRAMSVVMNEVEYDKFFSGESENDVAEMDNKTRKLLIDRPIRGLEAEDNEANTVKEFLTNINEVLEDTPFKLGYRAANEALLYVSAAHKFNPEVDIHAALDEFTMMKILSRIEGDKRSIGNLLNDLQEVITAEYPKSNEKLGKMAETLKNKQFVSYWT